MTFVSGVFCLVVLSLKLGYQFRYEAAPPPNFPHLTSASGVNPAAPLASSLSLGLPTPGFSGLDATSSGA